MTDQSKSAEAAKQEPQIADTTIEIEISSKDGLSFVSRYATARHGLVEPEISKTCATQLGFDASSPTLRTRWYKPGADRTKLSVFRIVEVAEGPNDILLSDDDYEHVRRSRLDSFPVFSDRKKSKGKGSLQLI